MPKFKVEVERSLGLLDGANPFEIRDIFRDRLVTMSIRVFEFEAKDETEVRRLFEEAKAADIAEVRGYSLRLIEQIGA